LFVVCILWLMVFLISLDSWYTKANLTNPKNGRPYNQLAILALYAVCTLYRPAALKTTFLSIIDS
jgi:hypothetical protein